MILTADRKTHLLFEALGINDRPNVPWRNEIELYPKYDGYADDLALCFQLVAQGLMKDERPNIEVDKLYSKHKFTVTNSGLETAKPFAWSAIKQERKSRGYPYVTPTAKTLERAFAFHFDYRKNIIVPNISWGLLNGHEADLLILAPSGYATEVEIKVSISDLKADKGKDKWKRYKGEHHSKMIYKFWYGITTDLYYKGAELHIPEHAGIIVYGDNDCTRLRQPKVNPDARKLSESERMKLLHLGVMRTWDIRETNDRLTAQNKALADSLAAELEKKNHE